MPFSKKSFLTSFPLLFLVACASTSVFNVYTNQAHKYKIAIGEDDTEAVLTKLAGKANSADKILYLQESGRIHQLAGQYEASQDDFRLAIDAYEANDYKARINATDIGGFGASLLTNDNAIPYKGYGYERIFVHQFQVFNYLAANDIEGASVEVRRAAQVQREVELQHQKEIAKAEEEAGKNGARMPPLGNVPEFSGMETLAGDVKNSFQNAYVFYTSAVIWEAQGDYNAALVDYKKALELNWNNEPLSTELKAEVKRVNDGLRIPQDKSSLVVLYEDGYIPERLGFTLSIPDFSRDTFWSVAFPYYSGKGWYEPEPISLKVGEQDFGQTQVIANFGQMAVRSLKEQVPQMVIRQLLRARAKYEIQKQANEQGNLSGFAAMIYNIVSEQPDLRSWLTLPNNAQVKRLELDPGEHTVDLALKTGLKSIDVQLNAGRVTILRVFNLNNRVKTQQFQL